MEEVDKAYLAGIIDGEGCISVVNGRQLIIKVAMYDKSPMELVSALFGSNLSPCKRGYQTMISGYRAKEVITDILPYLRGKTEQAKLALKYPLGKKHHKYSLSDVDYQVREDINFQLKEMKRGGN